MDSYFNSHMYLNTSNHFYGGAKTGNHFTRITYLNDDHVDSDSDSQSGGAKACDKSKRSGGKEYTDYSEFKKAIEAKDKKWIGCNIEYTVSTGADKHSVNVAIGMEGIVANGYVSNTIGNISIPSLTTVLYSALDANIQTKLIKALEECQGGHAACESHGKIIATMAGSTPVKISFVRGTIHYCSQ